MIDVKRLHDIIGPCVSGNRAFRDLMQICSHHRIQMSPGLTGAAHYCFDQLQAAGLQTELIQYPADGNHAYYACRPPRGWVPRAATLDVIGDRQRRIADFSSMPSALVARSAPTAGPIELDLVVLDRGDEAKHYSGHDVAGKIVLTRGTAGAVYEHAVVRSGAAGFILDELPDIPPVRQAPDLPDAHNYWMIPLSVPIPAGFGFSLSRRTGLWLRQLAADGPVRMRAAVDAEFADGTVDIVSALIPGTSDEEVLLIAHICHPSPSANDNASGVAAVVEVARSLAGLINRGELPTPERTIRFLLVPEMTGTYAFLAQNPGFASSCVAALNLDMVGEDQSQCGSSLLVEYPPRAQPSFTGPLLAAITEQVIAGSRSPTGGTEYPACRYNRVPFSGGSDHFVLSHPEIGIPCPMLIQWPDRFYHTSEDTPERVDPAMLGTVSQIAALYCVYLATANLDRAVTIAHEIRSRFPAELSRATGATLGRLRFALDQPDADREAVATDFSRMLRSIDFLRDRTICDIESVQRLVSLSEQSALQDEIGPLVRQVQTVADLERGRARLVIANVDPPQARPVDPALDRAVRLVHPGPIYTLTPPDNMGEEQRRQIKDIELSFHKRLGLLGPVVCYWLSGSRTVREAIELAELETGVRDDEAVLELMSVLLELGLAVEEE